jgi:hypothetical protein
MKMLLVRRYLAIAALLFWQGGFVFYASVVVPTGQTVLGSHVLQGHITREVAVWLNRSGAVALVLLAWDCFAARDWSRWRRRSRAALWLLMALTLAALFWMHPRLDRLVEKGYKLEEFRPLHRLYLWTHTVQWLAAVVYLGLTLAAWRAEDRGFPYSPADDTSVVT